MLDNRGPMSDRTCAIIAVVLLVFLIGSATFFAVHLYSALDAIEQLRMLR